jgi:uncharacterized membrane protein HdeD (DUF308 family)
MIPHDPNHMPLVQLMKQNRKFFLYEGIAFIVLGLFGLCAPQFFSLTLDYIIGWLLVLGSIVLGVRIIQTPRMPYRAPSIVSAILYFVLGVLFLAFPDTGIKTLTLLMGAFFLFDGTLKIYGSIQMRPLVGSGWLLFNGILSLILAFLIFISWTTAAAWVLGVLVGINLLFTGFALLGLYSSLSKE